MSSEASRSWTRSFLTVFGIELVPSDFPGGSRIVDFSGAEVHLKYPKAVLMIGKSYPDLHRRGFSQLATLDYFCFEPNGAFL
ncbi:MAG: hypothetical protein WBG19_05480 [Thermoplasmata archaeon]